LRASVWAASIAAPLLAGPGAADSQPPRFDVVSVKPTGEPFMPTGGGPSPAQWIQVRGNRLTCKMPLKLLIEDAFSLQDWQLNAPEWTMDELFDIQAILPQAPQPAAWRPMLRTMLAERFGLKFHREPKEVAAYALVVGKNGYKLHEAPESSRKAGMTARTGSWVFSATAMSMESIATTLRHWAGKPVFNMTGIEGVFDFDLRLAKAPDADPNREMLALIESQLGLKLESRKMPVEIFVVDHLDGTPTAN
jgi:uncharacterized protein (TIGR03435 family)